MTDPRGWALIGLTVVAWLWPQRIAEQWAVKSGVLTIALAGFCAWSVRSAARDGGRRELVAPALAFGGWIAATAAWSLDPVRSVAGAVAVGAAVFLLMGRVATSAGAVRALIVVIAICETVFALAVQRDLPRASGTFVNATHHAAAIALGAAALLPIALGGAGRMRGLALGGLALAAFGIAHSGSRAGMLALVAAFAVAGRARPSVRRIGAALAVVVAAVAAQGGIRERLAAQIAGGEVSAWDRVAIWKTSAGLALRHPFGVGFGAFGDAFAPVSPRPGVTTDYAHSEPVQVLVETGWPGLLLAGWLGWIVLRRMGGISPPLAALGVFVALDFPLHVPYLALAGLALVISALPAPARAAAFVRPVFGVAAFAVAAGAAVWIGGLAIAERAYARGYRLFAVNPPAAATEWERALAACPEYEPPRRALASLRRDLRR